MYIYACIKNIYLHSFTLWMCVLNTALYSRNKSGSQYSQFCVSIYCWGNLYIFDLIWGCRLEAEIFIPKVKSPPGEYQYVNQFNLVARTTRTIIVHRSEDVIYLVKAIKGWFWRRKHWKRILIIENQSHILLNSGWILIWIIL